MVDQALRQYVRTRSPEAFKALVDRHGKGVFAQCMRVLRDAHLAEDVSQAAVQLLARKAHALPQEVVLPAWLFKVTRYACANARRGQQRRQKYGQEAAMTRELQSGGSAAHSIGELETVVDGALARLGRVDREVIVLRFY